MNNFTKKILIIVGIILIILTLVYLIFFFVYRSNVKGELKTSTIELKEVNNLNIDVIETRVNIEESSDGINKIVITETDKIYHNVSEDDGNLNITRVSKYRFFEWMMPHFNLNLEMTLYLNDEALENVKINTVSSSINIAKLTSDNLNIKTVSGLVKLEDLNLNNLNLETVSGSIKGQNIISKNELNINSVSGSISFLNSDSNNIYIKNISGPIKLNLLTNKEYDIKSVSGKISKPSDGLIKGKCYINTVSGNVEITLAK